MRLTIDRMRLKAFKGVADLELELDGRDASVYGDNGVGKTTTADAWSWLLWGKDSRGRTDFETKTLDSTGEAVSGVDHSVEADVSLPDGRTVKLKRVYREKWTKRRGSAKAVMTGHETELTVDGVPTTKNEYDAFVSKICDEKTWRVLTDPEYFSEGLPWRERREMLLDAIGDVTDSEVVASNPELADLEPVVESGRTIDEHRRVTEAERKKTNRELERVPVRIDEVTRGLPDVEGYDEDAIRAELESLREERRELAEKREAASSGAGVSDLRRQIAEIDAEIAELKSAARKKKDEAIGAARDRFSVARAAVGDVDVKLNRLRSERGDVEASIETAERRMDERREAWKKVDAEFVDHDEPNTCAACGQELPEDQVEEARRRAIEKLNADKARRLSAIKEEGKKHRERRDELAKRLEEIEEEINGLEAEGKTARENLDVVEKEFRALQAGASGDDVAGVDELDAERRALAERISEARDDVSKEVAAIDVETTALDSRVAAAEAALARISERKRGDARIVELHDDERRLAAEYENLERHLYLCDLFIKTKTSTLEESVNSRFELARFRLFREQVNEGIRECCETTFEGVPFNGGLNDGARVNVGLDIIRTLSAIVGFAPPVWVDHAESVTRLVDVEAQTIRLVVSEDDEEIRVEYEDAEAA